MKILNVAEKPSMAKSITQALSGSNYSSRRGLNKYCMNYDFTYARICDGKRQVNMTMTSVLGHLMNYDFPVEYSSWQDVPFVDLLNAPLVKVVNKSCKDVKSNLEKESRGADWLVIWTDCDREGENIGYEIVEICRAVNPRLDVYRARFSVVSARELKFSFENLHRVDMNQALAVDARQQLDLRTGAAFTRLQTLTLRERFPSIAKNVISYGSCQFPTLGFIVEQYLRSINFIPEKFWLLSLNVNVDEKEYKFKWERGSIFNEVVCKVFFQIVKQAKFADVTIVEKKPTLKYRPLPLTTVEFQKFGSRYLKISSHKLMTIAENLYNRGIISYPRTETDIFEKAFNLKSVIEIQKNAAEWGYYSQALLDGKFVYPRRGKHNDESHPPIHPTACPADLHGEEKKVFDFIARRFLACCSDNAKGQSTYIQIRMGTETFSIHGIIIEERNYLEVYPYDKWETTLVPDLKLGDRFEPKSINMTSGTTTAPPLLSEADLIGTMDKNGIGNFGLMSFDNITIRLGTDATIHEHIKKVLDREYAKKRRDQSFEPTPLGLSLVEGFDAFGFQNSLTKPNLRAKTEVEIKGICEGKMTSQDFLNLNINLYRSILMETQANLDVLVKALARNLKEEPNLVSGNGFQNYNPPEPVGVVPADDNNQDLESNDEYPVGPCPMCGSILCLKADEVENKIYIGCSKFPNCRATISFHENLLESVSATNTECTNCSSKSYLINFEVATGQSMDLCIFCNPIADQYVNRDNARPTKKIRPNEDNHSPKCKCNESSKLVTTKKEGANYGRKFFSCPKAKGQGCDFFQWEDEYVPGAAAATKECFSNRIKSFTSNLSNSNNDASRSNNEFNTKSSNSVPQCECGVPCKVFVTKKVGPNQGREFYGCSVGKDRGCSFFKWCDEDTEEKSSSRYQSGTTSRNHGNEMTASRSAAPMSDILCICNKPAIMKTVLKSQNNLGRQYLVCAKTSNQCSFFSWLDEVGQDNNNNNSHNSNNGRGNVYKRLEDGDEGGNPQCDCGFIAKKGICKKEGPNQGKEFYSCPQSSYGKCKFFEWLEESSRNSSSIMGANAGNSARSNYKTSSTRGKARGKGKSTYSKRDGGACYKCNQVGHFASNCPE